LSESLGVSVEGLLGGSERNLDKPENHVGILSIDDVMAEGKNVKVGIFVSTLEFGLVRHVLNAEPRKDP
jgi:hypothetical protein